MQRKDATLVGPQDRVSLVYLPLLPITQWFFLESECSLHCSLVEPSLRSLPAHVISELEVVCMVVQACHVVVGSLIGVSVVDLSFFVVFGNYVEVLVLAVFTMVVLGGSGHGRILF